MTVAEAIHEGFALAHRRLYLLLIDVLWKAAWLSATLMLALGAAFWFQSQFREAGVDRESLASGLPFLVLQDLHRLWVANAGNLFWAILAVAIPSTIAWVILEAYFRAGILPLMPQDFLRRASGNFFVFLASGMSTRLALISAATVVVLLSFGPYVKTPVAEWPELWQETRSGVMLEILTVALFGFVLTVVETLVRGDALKLAANHLVSAVGIVGTLLLFEAFIVASVALTAVAALAKVSSLQDFLLISIFCASSFLLLNVLHTYLLLVRYFSIGIMQGDGREI